MNQNEPASQTTVLSLAQQAKFQRLCEVLITGEASSITQACQLSGVSRASIYRWQRDGKLADLVGSLQQGLISELATLLASKMPAILEARLEDALDNEVSVRDRCDASRIVLRVFEKMLGIVPDMEPEPEGYAKRWLRERGHEFPPVAIRVEGDVHIEQRAPGDYSPVLVRTDFELQQEGEE